MNTRLQLAEVTAIIQQRTLERLMLSGVTVVAPQMTFIDPHTQIGGDTVIEPFSVIRSDVIIGVNCRIGTHAVIDSGVQLPDGSQIAPFQHVTRD